MKKVYLVFSLLLMLLGINTAYAGVTWGGSVTDPKTLTDGSKIIIHTNKATDGKYNFISCLVDSMLFVSGTEDMLDPYVTFTMETANGKTVNGEQAYYLKNDYCGKYISYVFINASDAEGGSILEGGYLEMRMKFTDSKEKATPLIIKTQADGANMFKYKGDAPTEENCMMIIGQCPEYSNSLVAFNCNFASPYIASYADWAAWWQIGIANVNTNYIDDLSSLFTKVQNLTYKGGTAPGCYDQAMVDEFVNARAAADTLLNVQGSNLTNETAKVTYERLEKAYLALITGTPTAVHTGYFRIVTAFPNFASKQPGSKMTITASNDGHMNWKNFDETDATMVWQFIDRKDGTWLMYNVGTGQYVNGTNGSTFGSPWYSLGNDSTGNAIKFTYLGESQFNIAKSGLNSMHAGGHSEGAGTNGGVVTWNGGINTGSAWYVENVNADQIPGFEAIGDQNKLNRALELLYNEAYPKYQIGSSFKIDTIAANWLVTSEDFKKDSMVAFSNADHNQWHPDKPDGAGIPGLLDNDANTFWGSCWSDPQPDTTQYLQFKLNKAVNGFAVYLTKRQNQPNQATQLTFYVTNDTTDVNSWVKAGTISGLPASTDNSGNGLTYQSNGIELDGNYQYVRVYWTSDKGFTHFTGFHFQKAELSPNCQNATMGDVAKNLKKELSNAETLINSGKATQEAIDALQAAYDAYNAQLADPTALKAKMDSIQGVYDKAASPSMTATSGDALAEPFDASQPGVYTDENKAALKAVMDEVQKYLDEKEATGSYTKADIQSNMEKLTKAFDAFKATMTPIKACSATEDGHWYYLSASQHYFDVTGATQNTYGEGENMNIRKGKVYVKANVNTDNLNNASINVTGNKSLEELGVDPSMAKWRFVNMGDTAYAIQNMATGLYIGKKTGGNAGLSITPVGYTISEIGYATFILDGKQLNGEKTSPIHVQTNGQVVVFWDDHSLGSGSCYDIEDTKEVAEDQTVQTPTLQLENVVKGKLYTKCYPVTIPYLADNIDKTAYPYQIATIDLGKKVMTLTQYTEEITAGMPFFYIAGGSDLGVAKEPTAADTTQLIAMLNIDKVIAQTPMTVNGLVGNYYPTNVAKGFGVVNDEEGVQSIASTTEGQEIGWNSAYINAGMITNAEEPGEITVPLTGDLETAIKDAIIDAQTGNVNVYSIDGILIKKNVKVSEATKGLAKGIYIVGKQKIAVK